MTNPKPAPRELWIREWTDSQPDGFLSGEITHTPSYDVDVEPMEGAVLFIELSAYAALQARCEDLEQTLRYRDEDIPILRATIARERAQLKEKDAEIEKLRNAISAK